jgi:hydrogenase maturation protease
MTRILVAAVGNVLRRDDGFGAAVAARLRGLPQGVEVVETGIGGIALLQELLANWDGLVGCQPADVDELDDRLTPRVERAVAVAAAKVEEIVDAWL